MGVCGLVLVSVWVPFSCLADLKFLVALVVVFESVKGIMFVLSAELHLYSHFDFLVNLYETPVCPQTHHLWLNGPGKH